MGTSRSATNASDAETRRIAIALIGVILLALSLSAGLARAQNPVPMTVHGHAYNLAGAPLPVGTRIRALIDGVVYSNDSEVSDTAGTYSLLIAGNWMSNGTASETPTIKEGADLGETVTFAAGDFTNVTDVFQETVTWSPGNITALDLHVGIPSSQAHDVKVRAIATQPAQFNFSYVILCNPGATAVSLANYYLQTDVPGSDGGPVTNLTGSIPAGGDSPAIVTDPGFLNATGDALKLVFRNPGGGGAAAGGRDIPVDRVEFNATAGGTLDWEPGNTIMGDAPAPGPGLVLTRTPSCADTNSPQDFALAREPGLPANSTVGVAFVVPANGQVVPGGQSLTVQWALQSNTFTQFRYLRVWVNVSYAGTQVPLVAGAYGVTSVPWDVPNIAEPAATINVTVVDPFGARASQTVGFVIQMQSPWPLVLAFLIAIVVAAFLLLGYLSLKRSRAKAARPAAPPPTAPQTTQASVPAAPIAGTGPTGASMKVCPQCGTQVKAEDDSCFFCGHLFVSPPPP